MDAFDGVGRFVDTFLDDPTEAGLNAALAKHPDAGARLVDYLESRFVALEPMSGAEDTPEWWTMLEILASKWSRPERNAFVARVGLRAPADAFRWIAEFFRAAFTPEEIEPWLFERLEGADDEARERASSLAYHLFDGREDYELSPAGKARLRAIEPPG